MGSPSFYYEVKKLFKFNIKSLVKSLHFQCSNFQFLKTSIMLVCL